MQESSFLEGLKKDLIDLGKDGGQLPNEQKKAIRWFAVKAVILSLVLVYFKESFKDYLNIVYVFAILLAVIFIFDLVKDIRASILRYRERRKNFK